MELRPYQEIAVEKIVWSRQFEGGDLVVLPTGAGKSLVIAGVANRLHQDILILQPTREILLQNVEKMKQYAKDGEIGIYSASVNRKDVAKYTFATIGSIYKKPEEFKHFRIIIIDECHLLNPKRLDSMFMKLIRKLDYPKIIGFTATPYRLFPSYQRFPSGYIKTDTVIKLINRIIPRFWQRIVMNVNVEDMVSKRYLCSLTYVSVSLSDHKTIPVNKSRSDFDLTKYVGDILSDKYKWDTMVEVITSCQKKHKHCLVFCSSVDEAERLSGLVEGSVVVSSDTKKKDRQLFIEQFRLGEIKTVFNVGVLTIGFDFPELDCIVLARPTRSVGLYYQMLGRGVRMAEGKKTCTVYDTTGTVKALGPVESIKLVRSNGLWNLQTSRGLWHGKVLYSFMINK